MNTPRLFVASSVRRCAKALVPFALAACAQLASEGDWRPQPVADHARVIVRTPHLHLQAVARWRIARACCGTMELVHPATGRFVVLRWHGKDEQVRTSEAPFWRPLTAEARAKLGIPAPLAVLAGFLLARPPAKARRVHGGWVWVVEGRRVSVRVLAHGRGLGFEDPARGISVRVLVR